MTTPAESRALANLKIATDRVNVIARVIATEVKGRYQDGPCDVCGGDLFREYAEAVAVEDEARAVWRATTMGGAA